MINVVQDTFGRRSAFEKWIKDRSKMRKKAYKNVLLEELQIILEEVSWTGPARTGASAGEITRQRETVKSWHPAFGMTIGHAAGDSGWQIVELEDGWSLVNPMWDAYLKYLEFGVVEGDYQPHFVQRAWQNHLSRRADLRRKAREQ